MPKITSKIEVEDGYVVGTVSTNVYGSESTFLVCTIEEYEEMTEEESYKRLEEAMWESGKLEINF